MAFSEEEMNKRRRRREEDRKKREKQRRRVIGGAVAAAVIAVLCGILIFSVANGGKAPAPETPQTDAASSAPTQVSAAPTQPSTAPATQPAEPQSPTTVIHLAAAGDLIVNDDTVEAGRNVGGYDYTAAFLDVAPLLADADLTVVNFEGNLCGDPYGSATTSAPNAMMQAMANAGVDLVQMANSCSINNGITGLSTTLRNLRNMGLEPLGAFADTNEYRRSKGYYMAEVDGIRIAFVAFTKGMGSLGLPAGSEHCVNLLYTDYTTTYQSIDRDGIRAVLREVEQEKPDLTVALVHWGSEFNDSISSSQRSICSILENGGVDVVIGTHPHLLQRMTYNEETGFFAAYSLGDFFGDAKMPGTYYSVILNLEITRDNTTGQTRVTGYEYTPICTVRVGGALRAMRITNAVDAYERNQIDRLTDENYEDIVYALERIEARINPEE